MPDNPESSSVRHIGRIGGGAGGVLVSYALNQLHTPQLWIVIAAFVGLALLLWEAAVELRAILSRRNGSEGAKMAIIVLTIIGLGALGTAGLVYLIQTQPKEIETAAVNPPVEKPSPSTTIHQGSGQVAQNITNTGPVFNVPVTQLPIPAPHSIQPQPKVPDKTSISRPTSSVGIHIATSPDSSVSDSLVHNQPGGTGVLVENSDRTRVSGVTVVGGNTGFSVTGGTGLVFDHPLVIGSVESTADIAKLSDADLRDRVRKFADRMRKWWEFRSTRTSDGDKRMAERSFQAQFPNPARDYRAEMLRRIKTAPDENGLGSFFQGDNGDASMTPAIADYLDACAASLQP